MTERELSELLAVAESRRAALLAECRELFARLPDIRAAFGNPFSYSHPKHADESRANFTGYRSHEIVLPTVLEFQRVEAEIKRLKTELAALSS